MLVESALAEGAPAPQAMVHTEEPQIIANPTKALSGSLAVPKRLEKSLTQAAQKTEVNRKIETLAKLGKSLLVKTMIHNARKGFNKRLHKKQAVPLSLYPIGARHAPERAQEKLQPCPNKSRSRASRDKSQCKGETVCNSSGALGWPSLPVHSCDCPGSQDFSEAHDSSFQSGVSMTCYMFTNHACVVIGDKPWNFIIR